LSTETATFAKRGLRVDAPTVAVDVFLGAMKLFLVFFAAWAVLGAVVLQAQGQLLGAAAWRDVITGGLVQGAMYGLIALGYSMVYGILGFINFAHGEVFMSGAMGGFFMANATLEMGLWHSAFPVAMLLVLLASMLTSAAVAVTIEKVAYRRLRGAPRLIPLITSIGISFFLQYAVRGLFGGQFRRFPDFPPALSQRYSVFGLQIAGTRLVVIIVALVSVVGLWWFVTKSKTGRAIRAVAEDKEIAALMGIDVDRTIMMTFMVGGLMAGVAGTMWALIFRSVFFLTGFLPGIKAFTAAVLGGIGNLPGAMLGGLTLGIMEAAGPTLMSSLRWPIPVWLAYAIGALSLVVAFLGLRKLRIGNIVDISKSTTRLVLGVLMALIAFTLLPGYQVIIPGASQLKDMIAFIVLIGVLMIRPVGLLGERLSVEERG
jgi:branched-chain amino acid transport system permease protein